MGNNREEALITLLHCSRELKTQNSELAISSSRCAGTLSRNERRSRSSTMVAARACKRPWARSKRAKIRLSAPLQSCDPHRDRLRPGQRPEPVPLHQQHGRARGRRKRQARRQAVGPEGQPADLLRHPGLRLRRAQGQLVGAGAGHALALSPNAWTPTPDGSVLGSTKVEIAFDAAVLPSSIEF